MRKDGSLELAGEPPRLLKLAHGSEVAGFTIEGVLASGSFGTVYRATRGKRRFAIKLVPIGPRGDREVDALRKVRHPNVVGFHGYGLWPDEEPRFLVLALEFVEGRPLEEWAPRENPTALELVSQVLRPLAGTLEAVHAEGVVHRDVKEANIVMREADGQPVLVDFGAAGYEGATRLTMRLPPGTPEYRSPEALSFAREWEGELYPPRPGDDLWALGVTTYWLLTRTLPFGDRHNPRLVQAILQEHPVPPHELNPRVPRALSELCLRMLEKAPEARFADAGALAAALEEAAARADDSWRVPLFPGGKKEQRPAPAPAPPPAASEQPPSWWWLGAVGLMVSSALLLREPPEAPERTALAVHHTTTQASFGQEFDSADMTGEVVPSAEPRRLPTPAPIACAMHDEESQMFKYLLKSRTARFLAAATCLAGSACASGPQRRPPPPPEDCPPGAYESMKRLNLFIEGAVTFAALNDIKKIPIQEGPVTAEPFTTNFEKGSRLSGRLIVGSDRVYGRFTGLRLPSGEVVPVCYVMLPGYRTPIDDAVPLEEGSTPERPMIHSIARIEPVFRFE